MGDVAYYWARLAGAYRLDITWLVMGAFDGKRDAHQSSSFHEVAFEALHMTANTGRVVDVLKKGVRDGELDLELLRHSMRNTIRCWAQICRFCGIDWLEVIQANQIKVSQRAAGD